MVTTHGGVECSLVLRWTLLKPTLTLAGSTIAQWRKAKYHEQEEHEAFKLLLEAPQQEADIIVQERFPVPRFVDCDQHGSQARFLLAKLNPSATYQSNGVSGDVIFTDDVSLQVFMEHLKKLSVQSS